MVNRKRMHRWFWVPAIIVALGLLSLVFLVAIENIDDEQQRHFAFLDAIMEMQFDLTLSHLWLEQYIAGDTSIDMKTVWEDMDHALKLPSTLLRGAQSEHGVVLDPIIAPDLRAEAEAVKLLMNQFKRMAVGRLNDPEGSGIGTSVDHEFDAVFKEVLRRTTVLLTAAETDMAQYQVHSKRLFVGTLFLWTTIVGIATLVLWGREKQNQAAEQALHEARHELERRVEERTHELTSANARLQREVIERRRAEQNLRLYEEVANNMPIGLYVFRQQDGEEPETFTMVATNQAAARSTGVNVADILGKRMSESFPWLLKTGAFNKCVEVHHTGEPKDLGELYYRWADDTDVFFSVKAFPLPNNCLGVIFENITDRKTAERALLESERNFRRLSLEFNTLLDAIPDRLTLLAPDMRILWANKEAAEAADLYGLASRTRKYCYEVWHGLSAPCDYCPVRKSFASGNPESTEVMTSNGKFWNVRAYPIRNESGKVVNVIEMTTDVSERIAFQTEAMRTAHLASLGKLAAGVAHEVNNPTNCIINYAQILSNRSQRDTELHDVANRIIKEGTRISRIVGGLLSFARERGEDKLPVRIAEIWKDSLVLCESVIRKQGIRVEVDFQADLPEIQANAQQIQQVFLNVVNNAQYALQDKYPGFDENKLLEVRAENRTLDGHPWVSILFRDYGCGIPGDITDNIMLPFFTTKPPGKGTGLGLSICHGIINDHGGKLTVRSVKGDWTEVEILLPAKELA